MQWEDAFISLRGRADSTGQDVLNVVYQHLGSTLLETAYFGLRYVDATHQPQWLDPNKRVLQQLKGTGSQTLYFAVKFYAVDPCKLVEELTRANLCEVMLLCLWAAVISWYNIETTIQLLTLMTALEKISTDM
ncbi:hypothetical protein OUZ56_008128 [Daphnia magna]|uniref:FERM domain-containing protein n=1 Tax=Daphnia magna TaxID=35525 RepID=A0ABR0ACB1_9CRUS|nr:hypothetical protein OUZ56_008128 [Daphnia magna]